MSLLVGCPVILSPRDDVLASWTHSAHLIVINGAQREWMGHGLDIAQSCLYVGAGENIGVAASWNRIFEIARDKGFSHVALISQGVVLEGGTERLADLVDEYADHRGLLTDFAWHVIVLSVAVWEQLGKFDTRFTPAYFEDSDYTRRLFLAGVHTPENRMPKVERDLLDGTETVAAAMHLIPPDTYGLNAARYRAKWGGEPFKETWTRPYDPSSLDATHNWSHHDGPHEGRPVNGGSNGTEE